MEKVTDMFRHTFPYTTIYPSLGNLDITSSSMLSNRFPKPGSPYHRARRPHGQGSNRNGHRRRGKKGNVVFKANETKHMLMRFQCHLQNAQENIYNLSSIQFSSIK